MKTLRAPMIALSIGIGGVVLFAVAGFAVRDGIRESYWLWKLEKGGEKERHVAVGRLGELRSLRAVPAVLRWIGSTPVSGEADLVLSDRSRSYIQRLPVSTVKTARAAFLSLGPAAIPVLTGLSGEQNRDPATRFWARVMLGELEGPGPLASLERLDPPRSFGDATSYMNFWWNLNAK